MDVRTNNEGRYLFGPFELDPRARLLSRDGVPVALTNRVFETLLVFVRNPGRVLTKDELLGAVWPGRFMEESSLKQAIFTLRKALGGDNDDTRYIATASGRGYSLTVPVRQVGFEHSARAPAARIADDVPFLRARPTLLAAGLTGVVILVGIAFAVLRAMTGPGQPAQTMHMAFRPPPRSIAVLAFANMSGDPSQDYLADGLSEELTNALSRVAALRVASRTSAFFFKTHPATIGDIAQRLNTGAILEGSIRREGSRLRVTAQLINAVTGYHYWSHDYDRQFADILDLETEIAEDVTRSLQLTLQPGDAARLTMAGTKSTAAFDAFLKGQRLMNGRNESAYRSALAEFDEAARLDPQYAAAEAKRAFVLMFLSFGETTRDVDHVRSTLDEAMRAANRAVALAPDWGLSHAALGDVLAARLDLAGAERELTLARNLTPDEAITNRSYAFLEAELGHSAVAESAMAEAVARHSAEAFGYASQGQLLYLDRDYEASLAAFRHAQALSGTQSTGDQMYVAFDDLALGKPDLARTQCAAGVTYQEIMCLAIVDQKLGRAADADAHLAKLRAMLGDTGAFQYAEIYAQRGEANNALAWLNKAEALHDTGLAMLRVDPLLDPIRGAKGFDATMRRVNFPS